MAIDAKMNPRYVRVFFIIALQRYFENHPEYPWKKDRAKSKVYIQEDFPEDTKYEDILPAVIVDGDGIQYNEEGVGNVHAMPKVNPYQHKIISLFTIRSAMNIHCVAESSVVAEELACEVAGILITLKNSVKDVFNLQFIGMPRQSKPQQTAKQGKSSTYDCTVSLEFYYARKTEVTPIDKGSLLKSIEMYLVGNEWDGNGTPESEAIKDGTPNAQINNGSTMPGGISPQPSHNGDGSTDPTKPHNPDDPNQYIDDRSYGGWVYLRMKIEKDSVETTQDI